MYFQKEIECASPEEIRRIQDEKLLKQVRHVWDNAEYYRKKMEKKGLTPDDIKSRFSVLGASCHHWCEAQSAQKAGAAYITAGHIFATDCKKGLPPRGLDFLAEVCRSVNVPVYAIGGISAENIDEVRRAGAAGGCIMSGLMSCPPEKIKDILDM